MKREKFIVKSCNLTNTYFHKYLFLKSKANTDKPRTNFERDLERNVLIQSCLEKVGAKNNKT